MTSIRDLFGYDLHTSRTAFEKDGHEVVFVNDLLACFRRVYIDGEHVFSRFSLLAWWLSDTRVMHAGKEYRIVSRVTNWVWLSQEVTVYVDGVEIGRKRDPVYASLSTKNKVKALLGCAGVGFVAGFLAAYFF